MNKKLVILVALLFGVRVVAMEQIKETPVLQESSHHEEESRVKICLTDSQNPETPHEVAIPARLAKLIGAFNELVEDPQAKNSGFPLPNVTIVQWHIIERQLERLYYITHDASQAAHLRQEMITEFCKLDAKTLIGVVCALEYLYIPMLLESACEVLKQSALDKIFWEELEELPFHIRNQIIMHKVIMLLGPVPARELAICGGHGGAVFSVCVTQEGKVVSGSRDKTVRIWDMEGNQLAVYRGHELAVNSVYVTKDGKIVSGSYDATVRIWDMQGNQLAVCRGHERAVNSVYVTKDGKIVSGSNDSTVRVWDMEGNQLAVCRGHEGMVMSVCVTNDGKIVSGSEDKTVRVWDMQGNQFALCRGHEGGVTSVCVTIDGKIVSGSVDKTVRVWDMEGNQLAVCRGHEDVVRPVCVTIDGKIVSGSQDSTVRVWDIEGNQLAVCRRHESAVTSVCVTQDGKIVSGSRDRTVRVWDIEGNQLAVSTRLKGWISSVCVTQDGKIVSGSLDKMVHGVWDISLLNRINCMEEDQARALWGYMGKLSGDVDKQKCWREIEQILGEDAPVPPANINNNNNE